MKTNGKEKMSRYSVNIFVNNEHRIMDVPRHIYDVIKGMTTQVNEYNKDYRMKNISFTVNQEINSHGATIFRFEWMLNGKRITDLGFEDEYDFIRLVNSVKLSTKRAITLFNNWQNNIGTKDGLIQLRFNLALLEKAV